jgi:hypothetical protein
VLVRAARFLGQRSFGARAVRRDLSQSTSSRDRVAANVVAPQMRLSRRVPVDESFDEVTDSTHSLGVLQLTVVEFKVKIVRGSVICRSLARRDSV